MKAKKLIKMSDLVFQIIICQFKNFITTRS